MEKIKILIVDDEQIVIDSIKRLLKKVEMLELESSLSAPRGLELANEFRPDIILVDLMMPEIDGIEFLKEIKKNNPFALVIIITGYATINTALQAMQFGAFDYISKPFTRDELLKVIDRASSLIKSKKNQKTDLQLQKDVLGGIRGAAQYSWLMMTDEGLVLLGIERAVLYSIGGIQTIYLPSVGDEIRQGSVYFQIFSTDLRIQSIISPLSGTVVEVNNRILQKPDLIVQDPYGEGWLLKVRPSNFEKDMKTLGLL
ncbi:MAG: response regulator [Ignavibacteria bacterium]|nr:response regulator [Ignavibacteria bacterium]